MQKMKTTILLAVAVAFVGLPSSSCLPVSPGVMPRAFATERNEMFAPEMASKNKDFEDPDARMEFAVQWAIAIAMDPVHGYSQGGENATVSHPYTGSREGPDYDCASFVYHALDCAGFDIIAAWRKNPFFYGVYNGKQETGDADTVWIDLQLVGGFSKYSWENIRHGLKRGDILCEAGNHIAIYIGNGKTVEARGVENPRGGDWRSGDQGGEIDIYDMEDHDWTEVYRYTGRTK